MRDVDRGVGLSYRAAIRLEPWGTGDLPLLEKCLGDPAMILDLLERKVARPDGTLELV